MRIFIAIAVLAVGGFFFFGIYWPKHQHQLRIDEASAVADTFRAKVLEREADLETIVKTLDGLALHDGAAPGAASYAIVSTGALRTRVGLERPKHAPAVSDELSDGEALSLVGTDRATPNDDVAMAQRVLGPIANMRYAVLLDTTSYTEPELLRDNQTFKPGSWSGKAYFFDVPARKYLAGWVVTSGSSDRVETYADLGVLHLIEDFDRHIATSVHESVATHVQR